MAGNFVDNSTPIGDRGVPLINDELKKPDASNLQKIIEFLNNEPQVICGKCGQKGHLSAVCPSNLDDYSISLYCDVSASCPIHNGECAITRPAMAGFDDVYKYPLHQCTGCSNPTRTEFSDLCVKCMDSETLQAYVEFRKRNDSLALGMQGIKETLRKYPPGWLGNIYNKN